MSAIPAIASISASKPWREVYDTVYELYWVEDQTLEETMNIMNYQHNFSATKKQWVSKPGKWKLKNNISTKEMQNMDRIQRKRRLEEEKDTRFSVRGRDVSQCNIDQWEKRQKGDPGETLDQAETLSDISYDTPSEASRTPSGIDPATPRPVAEESAALDEQMPDRPNSFRLRYGHANASHSLASIVEINRGEMYSSDSSDSLVATLDAAEYKATIDTPQA
ncbi:hypothetical protein B0T14DRAFT_605742 [Immersiella caudata]|uniref:Clr5 domain-containing protein n=1 Tax=Immersiella caudata TaxID=314043 RepID=A0AA39WM15_9PEZI|nr:hypothetical protein B0T14DRAFT_605742 [Immersiella caudata]